MAIIQDKHIRRRMFWEKLVERMKICRLILMVPPLLLVLAGCSSPRDYRLKADKTASDIITDAQKRALGRESSFSIERPSETFRRRLLLEQGLPYAGQASLGADKLKKIEHWPQDDYPSGTNVSEPNNPIDANTPVTLSLIQALEVGAANSFDYQSRKEGVFQTALALDLERNQFRNIFTGQINNLISADTTADETVSGNVTSGQIGLDRKLENGADLTTALAVDLANLMTMGGASSIGIAGDASISIPLLRGSGRFIVTEPLTQAERNIVYAIWQFERFKEQFAVDIASNYLSVLSQLDALKNTEEDYRSNIASARRSRRLADAGRLTEIEVDQAVQNELRARQRWISATQQYKNRLDSFKTLLGLPPDAYINLDPNELKVLSSKSLSVIKRIAAEETSGQKLKVPSADAAIHLVEPNNANAGPLEMNELAALKLALDNRLDLKVALGKTYDSQRAVAVAADALGAELTFFGSAEFGQGRSITSADADNAHLRLDKGVYSALLTLDLPLERTKEAINYRNSLIDLEQVVRDVQALEDQIKLAVRNELRDILGLVKILISRQRQYFLPKNG